MKEKIIDWWDERTSGQQMFIVMSGTIIFLAFLLAVLE